MKIFTVSFFGHRQLENAIELEQKLETVVRQLLLEKEYVEFLVGRDGEFDLLAASVIRRCKREVRNDNSSLVWVLPYETADHRNNCEAYLDYYDEIEVADIAGHYKSAFQTRNRRMVDRSDLAIFCVQRKTGGAWQTFLYAQKLGKRYLNLDREYGVSNKFYSIYRYL